MTEFTAAHHPKQALAYFEDAAGRGSGDPAAPVLALAGIGHALLALNDTINGTAATAVSALPAVITHGSTIAAAVAGKLDTIADTGKTLADTRKALHDTLTALNADRGVVQRVIEARSILEAAIAQDTSTAAGR